MADTYDISTGSGRVELSGVQNRFINLGQLGTLSVQVISDVSLDAPVTLKLQQSIAGGVDNDINWVDVPKQVPLITDAGANSNILHTKYYYLNKLALHVDVGSATTGILTIYNVDND